MSTHQKSADHGSAEPSAVKDPSTWKTGDEPMTASQHSYLETLGQDCGEEVPDDLTKAEASQRIDELREKSTRVQAES